MENKLRNKIDVLIKPQKRNEIPDIDIDIESDRRVDIRDAIKIKSLYISENTSILKNENNHNQENDFKIKYDLLEEIKKDSEPSKVDEKIKNMDFTKKSSMDFKK